MKKVLSLVLSVVLLFSVLTLTSIPANAATFSDINSSSVFVKQQTNYTCTLASAVMLVRRASMMAGKTNWASVTESSMRSTAWVENSGLKWSFTYNGISVGHGTLSGGSGNKSTLISLLANHPEGIIAYNSGNSNQWHAILLTDYTNGTFYCADPAGNSSGRVALTSSTIKGSGQDGKLANFNAYWYVTSPKLTLSTHTHTWKKAWFWAQHPHYNEYKCTCGASYVDYNSSNFYTKCETCLKSTTQHTASGSYIVTSGTYAGHKYELYNDSAEWEEAKIIAEKKGGYLVTITSSEEQKHVEHVISKYATKNTYWLGANDPPAPAFLTWVTGEESTYRNWGASEPSHSSENYVQILAKKHTHNNVVKNAYTWNDTNQAGGNTDFYHKKNTGFIIEYDNVVPPATKPTTQPITNPTTKPTVSACTHPLNSIIYSAKGATYFEKGYSNYKICSSCGVTLDKGTEIECLKLKTPKFSLKGAKKKFTVKYTKVKDATGFEVRYRIKGSWKTVKVNTKKSFSKTIKNLKKGKYQVQIRAFIKQNKKTAYSQWSATKKVTVKELS